MITLSNGSHSNMPNIAARLNVTVAECVVRHDAKPRAPRTPEPAARAMYYSGFSGIDINSFVSANCCHARLHDMIFQFANWNIYLL